MEQHLGQKQQLTQKQLLTPQLKQFLQLLELPVVELDQRIEEELVQNPTLEESIPSSSEDQPDEAPSEPDSDSDLKAMESWLDATSSDDKQFEASVRDSKEVQMKRNYQESILSQPQSISEYLEWQLGLLDLNTSEHNIALQIIGNINDDGYLTASISEISIASNEPEKTIEKVLRKIQSIDPPGIAAEDLRDCLLIQLSRRNHPHAAMARSILENYFYLFQRKNIDQLAHALHKSTDEVKKVYSLITQLEPKPGRIFFKDSASIIIPEAKVTIDEATSELVIEMKNERYQRLRINPRYRNLYREKGLDQKTKAFLKGKIQSGLELMRALAQRNSTLQSITEELTKVQREFFMKGFSFLKPLRLKDVSVTLRIHESTVSRAIHSKYMETPQGIVSYKSFFSTRLGSDGASTQSQKGAMESLRQLIQNEDKKKPLGDAKLVDILKGQGIPVARRTVAKYRDVMKILPAYLRKQR
jgi:RNA polymerase sigma-54 factor